MCDVLVGDFLVFTEKSSRGGIEWVGYDVVEEGVFMEFEVEAPVIAFEAFTKGFVYYFCSRS